MNKSIDYLQELKRDVSTKGILTPLQKRCFEKMEETLNQPVKDLKKLYDEISYRLMPNPTRDLKMYEFLREVKQLIEIHYQPDPTIEEVKEEWEDDVWKWIETRDEILLVFLLEHNHKEIFINKKDKKFACTGIPTNFITVKEHIRLTKTFRALGWEV